VDQTLTLDGEDIAHEPRLLLWQPGEDQDALVVENVSYPGLTHRRAVLFVKRQFFVIVDEALGDATGDLRAHFRLAPGPSVMDEGKLYARTNSPGDANILVQGMPADGVAMAQEDGWVSFTYGVREPRPAFCFRTDKGQDSVRFVTLMIPYRDNEPPKARVSIVGDPGPGAARLELDVTVQGGQSNLKSRIGYSL
jgi:heparan-sulfate lyase